jgi:uncharacterized membrane protein
MIEDKLSELEKILKINPEPEISTPKHNTQTREKPPLPAESATRPKFAPVQKSSTESNILKLLENKMTTLEIVAAVNKHAICSQATIFRYLKKLTKQGKIQRIRRGRHVYYVKHK